MTDPDPNDVWLIVLSPGPSDVPAAARVKRLLKYAKRSLGLRCVRAESGSETLTAPVRAPAPAPEVETET